MSKIPTFAADLADAASRMAINRVDFLTMLETWLDLAKRQQAHKEYQAGLKQVLEVARKAGSVEQAMRQIRQPQ